MPPHSGNQLLLYLAPGEMCMQNPVALSREGLLIPNKLCQSSLCERQPLWRSPEVPQSWSNPLCPPLTVTVLLLVSTVQANELSCVLLRTTMILPDCFQVTRSYHPSHRNQVVAGKGCRSYTSSLFAEEMERWKRRS